MITTKPKFGNSKNDKFVSYRLKNDKSKLVTPETQAHIANILSIPMQKTFHVIIKPQSGTFMTSLGFSIVFL